MHPIEDSVLQTAVERLAETDRGASLLHQNPLLIHELLFQSYIGNWRFFLRERGSDFAESVSIVPRHEPS